MNRYGIGYNKMLGVYFSKQDMIDYHRYKASVLSDESQSYHFQMIEKLKNTKNTKETKDV